MDDVYDVYTIDIDIVVVISIVGMLFCCCIISIVIVMYSLSVLYIPCPTSNF